MKNKVTNRFFSKPIFVTQFEKFEGNTENTRSSIDDRGSERAKCKEKKDFFFDQQRREQNNTAEESDKITAIMHT